MFGFMSRTCETWVTARGIEKRKKRKERKEEEGGEI